MFCQAEAWRKLSLAWRNKEQVIFMESISLLIRNHLQKPVNPKGLKHEWMAFAYKVWKEYDNNKKNLPNIIKFFRTYNPTSRNLLDLSYNFCSDYTGQIPKIKLFFWKFWQLKNGIEKRGVSATNRMSDCRG